MESLYINESQVVQAEVGVVRSAQLRRTAAGGTAQAILYSGTSSAGVALAILSLGVADQLDVLNAEMGYTSLYVTLTGSAVLVLQNDDAGYWRLRNEIGAGEIE